MMYSEIDAYLARDIWKDGWHAYMDDKHEFEDCPYHPNEPYTKTIQDKKAAWQSGYNFAKRTDNNE